MRPAPGADVRAVREYVESTLGFQVWANHVYETIRSRPHAGTHEHQDVAA